MTRQNSAIAALLLATILLFATALRAEAQQETKAHCEVMAAGGMAKAAANRTQWMNTQLGEGRFRFVSDAPGILCAW